MGLCISSDARYEASTSMPAAPDPSAPFQPVAARSSHPKHEASQGHREEEPDAFSLEDLEIGSDFISCNSHGTHDSFSQQSVIEETLQGTSQLQEAEQLERPAQGSLAKHVSRHTNSRAASCAREALQVFQDSEEGCSSACKVKEVVRVAVTGFDDDVMIMDATQLIDRLPCPAE
eukprot:1139250-Pelagomonas_calceolata.AAC.5